MVRPVDFFRQAIAKAQQTTSSGGAAISEQEAREALYPALKAQDSFERAEVVQSITELLNGGAAMSAKVRKLLDSMVASRNQPLSQIVACWKSWALAQASAAGTPTVSSADLREIVSQIRSRNDSERNKAAAMEVARSVAAPADWQAVVASEAPPAPTGPLASAGTLKALEAFDDAVARLARQGANIDRPRALSALYLLSKGVDPADAGLVAEAIGKALVQATWSRNAAAELKKFAAGHPTTRQIFDCWAAAAAAAESASGTKIDEAELKEGLALLALQDLSPEERTASIERLRRARLTETARALLGAEHPDAAAATSRAVARFREVVALFRRPESDYQQNLNLPEALCALHELLAPGVDPGAAAEAVRAVLAEGRLGSKAGPMLQAFAANPRVDASRRFECWLAHAGAAQNQAGQGIAIAELEEGLGLLGAPELSGDPAAQALKALRAARLSPEAAALLASRFPTTPTPPTEPQAPSGPTGPAGDKAQATAAALDRFHALLERYRLPESEYAENLNLAEALSALYLLAVDVEELDVPAVTDAVRAVLACGQVGPKATAAFQTFADNPAVDAPRLFDYWLAHMSAAESDAGRVISAAEVGQGLTILALPAMSDAARRSALGRLGAAQLSLEARQLLEGYLATLEPLTPPVAVDGGARELDVSSVLARFRAQEANRGLPEPAILERFYRHALTRHTGKTDQEIVDRLSAEPNISGSGAFVDEATTFRVVDAAVRSRYDYIVDWMKRVPVNSMLNLTYRGETVIGRDILRGEPAPYDVTNASVVIQKLDATTYRIITAFPEP